MTKVIAIFRDCIIAKGKGGCNLDILLTISDEMKEAEDRIIIFLPHIETINEWQARIKKAITDRALELGFTLDSITMPSLTQTI